MATSISPSLVINATYQIQTDDIEAYKDVALRMAAAANKRDGCSFVKVAQDAADPATFYLIEGWRDQSALDAHFASADFQTIAKEASELKITNRFADVFTVSETKPLPMP